MMRTIPYEKTCVNYECGKDFTTFIRRRKICYECYPKNHHKQICIDCGNTTKGKRCGSCHRKYIKGGLRKQMKKKIVGIIIQKIKLESAKYPK